MTNVEAEGRGGSRLSIVVARVAAVVFTALYFFDAIRFVVRGGQASTEVFVFVPLLGLAAMAAVLAWYSAARGALGLAAAGLALVVFAGVFASQHNVVWALLLGFPYLLTATVLWFGARRTASV